MDQINRSSELQTPSGLEVESARFHPVAIDPARALPEPRLRDRIDEWRTSGRSRMVMMKRSLVERTDSVKSMVTSQTSRVRPALRDLSDRSQGELRANPTKWAGVAAATGMLLGGIGRYLRHRAKVRRMHPTIVVIEASC